jgi:hypothetical protein
MIESIRRFVAFAFVALAFSYGVLFIGGRILEASASVPATPLVIRDLYTPGSHIFSGALRVPLSCDHLSVHVKENSTSTYALIFTTWQDPSVVCLPTEELRTFKAVAFTSSSTINFDALLDGASIPIVIVPDHQTK